MVDEMPGTAYNEGDVIEENLYSFPRVVEMTETAAYNRDFSAPDCSTTPLLLARLALAHACV
jgi:hypothetical protein